MMLPRREGWEQGKLEAAAAARQDKAMQIVQSISGGNVMQRTEQQSRAECWLIALPDTTTDHKH